MATLALTAYTIQPAFYTRQAEFDCLKLSNEILRATLLYIFLIRRIEEIELSGCSWQILPGEEGVRRGKPARLWPPGSTHRRKQRGREGVGETERELLEHLRPVSCIAWTTATATLAVNKTTTETCSHCLFLLTTPPTPLCVRVK